MAFLQCNFHSDALGMAASMNVILPQKSRTQIGMGGAEAAAEGAPVLYLLHGLSDDHTIWMRRTSIERYAATTGLVVVMPSVNRSFYNNTPDGMRFWDYISEELPALLPTFFHVSTRREDTFVAGLSMGGFGAFKLALNHPDRYGVGQSLGRAPERLALHGEPETLRIRLRTSGSDSRLAERSLHTGGEGGGVRRPPSCAVSGVRNRGHALPGQYGVPGSPAPDRL